MRSFNAYADRNGHDFGQTDPRDVGRPAELRHLLDEDPGPQAETARIASGFSRLDSTVGGNIDTVEATEAETPKENLEHLSNASTSPTGQPRK
ncbi:hypothetical protein ACRAWG_09980 [Methylobacterium sp. P31]